MLTGVFRGRRKGSDKKDSLKKKFFWYDIEEILLLRMIYLFPISIRQRFVWKVGASEQCCDPSITREPPPPPRW
jgi:hypothetical protein